MKWGITSNSLTRAIIAGEMSILDVIDWTKRIGGSHLEVVPRGFDLERQPELIPAIRKRAAEAGIELSNYIVSANFKCEDDDQMQLELDRVKRELRIARDLGITRVRHDVASRPPERCSIRHFREELPKLAGICREIADDAASLGIATSVENHGYYMQASERIGLLAAETGPDRFRTTLDVGNFLCVDESPERGVRNNIGFASSIHLKDFYVRPRRLPAPGDSWFPTAGGSLLRGAIVGQGDIDMAAVFRIIRESGYDGYIAVEFEGLEECRAGTAAGFDYARALWARIG